MRAVRLTFRTLVWVVLVAALGVVAVAVVVPRVAGGTPYTVLTGSMEPGLPPGTLVVVRPVSPEEVRVGDVVTYQVASGESTVVTHRVTAVGTRLDGELAFTTQGDANDVADPAPVRAVQVRGRLWYAIPHLGRVNSLLTDQQRQTAVIGVAALLVGYAAFMFVGALRDRSRRRRPEHGRDEVTAPQVPTAPVAVTTPAAAPHARGPVRTTVYAVTAGVVLYGGYRVVGSLRGRGA